MTAFVNDIQDFKLYLFWLVLNVQKRVIESDINNCEKLTMPRERQVFSNTKDKVGRLISIYDPKAKFSYDHISYEGLTPYDYKQALEVSKLKHQ